MSPWVLAWVPVILMVLANRWAAREWLGRFVVAHPGVVPGFGWVVTRDADPEVERWRRIRLAVIVGELLAFALALYGITLIA